MEKFVTKLTEQNLSFPSQVHDRFDLSAFAPSFQEIQERDLRAFPFVASPIDIYGVEKLRAKWLDVHQSIESVPVELTVWGTGEPKNLSATKVGGAPVWDSKTRIPKGGWSFFAQFNFSDSIDLPFSPKTSLLSIWVNEEFPWGKNDIKCVWIDGDTAEPNEDLPTWKELPEAPFFAQLYRSWEPIMDWDDDREVAVDNKFKAYQKFSPRTWKATKFSGNEAMPQWGNTSKLRSYFAQFTSIQPTAQRAWPW
ncbi:MAG: DUF1963 domain-containing protein, partial [Verrucomicrobiota bacterium]